MLAERSACVALLAALALGGPSLSAQDAPDFEFDVETIDGEKITNDDLREKVVLLDFWGTWCGPCKKAIPHLIKLHEKYGEQGLVILGLNYEKTADPLRTVRAYADKHGIPYPLAIGSDNEKDQVENFGGFPTMLFFKRGLRLDRKETGFTVDKVAAIEEWVVAALAEKTPKKVAGPFRSMLESGDKKIAIGDGKSAVLLVLTHPKAPADPKLVARLREIDAGAEGFRVVTVAREDVEGAKADFVVTKDALKPFRLGKAFPAYKLYDAQGVTRLRDSGIGESVHRAVLKAAAPYASGAKPAEKKPIEKKPTEQRAPGDKPAAGKAAAKKRRPMSWRRW